MVADFFCTAKPKPRRGSSGTFFAVRASLRAGFVFGLHGTPADASFLGAATLYGIVFPSPPQFRRFWDPFEATFPCPSLRAAILDGNPRPAIFAHALPPCCTENTHYPPQHAAILYGTQQRATILLRRPRSAKTPPESQILPPPPQIKRVGGLRARGFYSLRTPRPPLSPTCPSKAFLGSLRASPAPPRGG